MKDTIIATAGAIGSLTKVPPVFKLGAMLLLKAECGTLTFRLPDGRKLVFKTPVDEPDATILIHDYTFIRRALTGGDIGFAEAYIDGMWSSPDLTAVLKFFSRNFEAAGRLAEGGFIARTMNLFRHVFARQNSREGAKKNIMAHYDLGNEFYAAWLDESMTYSSAMFYSPNESLLRGQMNKYRSICDGAGVTPSSHILEIGCGWGGFSEYAAAQRGAKVTCLTISPSQRDYALARIQKAGLGERVDIRLEDYRDHHGAYDGVASIEMFEAVGEKYWPDYFAKVYSSLKSGGRAALQIITIDDPLFEAYRKRVDFIQRYIFPGGMLISEQRLKEGLSKAGLQHDGVKYFGQDYARTCREWARTFNQQWDQIQAMGFDEPFRKLWNFYLSYCEAGFSDRRINVGQFQLSRPT